MPKLYTFMSECLLSYMARHMDNYSTRQIFLPCDTPKFVWESSTQGKLYRGGCRISGKGDQWLKQSTKREYESDKGHSGVEGGGIKKK